MPIVPDGFTVTLFADGLPHPRRIAVLPDDTVFVVQQNTGQIIGLADKDGDGVAEIGGIYGENLAQPFGLAVAPAGPFAGDLLMSDPVAIYRLPLTGGEVATLTARGAFGDPAGHITRALAIEPGTGAIFVAVGSMSNLAEEPEVKATIQRLEPDGSGQATFARGLRNATGLAFAPNGDLYAVVMERDAMGDALVPDFFAKVSEGDDFGWPYQYAGGIVQPEFSDGSSKRAAAKLPEVMFEAHSAPMDVIFLPDTWPEDYRGDAIVALKGSSNREIPTGYKLVRIDFADGAPGGRLRQLRHRLLGERHLARRSLGPPRRTRADGRRRPPRRRRFRRHDLEDHAAKTLGIRASFLRSQFLAQPSPPMGVRPRASARSPMPEQEELHDDHSPDLGERPRRRTWAFAAPFRHRTDSRSAERSVPADQLEGVQAKCDELFATNSDRAIAQPERDAGSQCTGCRCEHDVAATESPAEAPVDPWHRLPRRHRRRQATWQPTAMRQPVRRDRHRRDHARALPGRRLQGGNALNETAKTAS